MIENRRDAGKNRPNPVNPGANVNTQTGQYTKGISDRTRGNTGGRPRKPTVPRRKPRRPKRPNYKPGRGNQARRNAIARRNARRRSNRRPQLKREKMTADMLPVRGDALGVSPIGGVVPGDRPVAQFYNPNVDYFSGMREAAPPRTIRRPSVRYDMSPLGDVVPGNRPVAQFYRPGGNYFSGMREAAPPRTIRRPSVQMYGPAPMPSAQEAPTRPAVIPALQKYKYPLNDNPNYAPMYPLMPSGLRSVLTRNPSIPQVFQEWNDYVNGVRDMIESAQQPLGEYGGGGGYSGGGGGYSGRRRSYRRSYRPYSRRSSYRRSYGRSYGSSGGGGGGGTTAAAEPQEYEQYGITPEWMEAYKNYWGHELPKEYWGVYDPIVQLFAKYTGTMPQINDWMQMWSQMQEQATAEEPLTDMWRPIYQYDPLFRGWSRPPLFTPPDITYSQEQSY